MTLISSISAFSVLITFVGLVSPNFSPAISQVESQNEKIRVHTVLKQWYLTLKNTHLSLSMQLTKIATS